MKRRGPGPVPTRRGASEGRALGRRGRRRRRAAARPGRGSSGPGRGALRGGPRRGQGRKAVRWVMNECRHAAEAILQSAATPIGELKAQLSDAGVLLRQGLGNEGAARRKLGTPRRGARGGPTTPAGASGDAAPPGPPPGRRLRGLSTFLSLKISRVGNGADTVTQWLVLESALVVEVCPTRTRTAWLRRLDWPNDSQILC
jgi:hypothetical protein